MSAPSTGTTPSSIELDLTVPGPLAEASRALEQRSMPLDVNQTLTALTIEDQPSERIRRLSEVLRKLDTDDIVLLVLAAGQSSLRHEPAGLRFLFDFLEVKRPGVEVLRQLELLSSLERVSLQIVGGRWEEPEESSDSNSLFPILDVLEESARVGVLDLGLEMLPRHPVPVRSLLLHIRRWFQLIGATLEKGERIPEALLHFLTQLSMLEINLLEKRLLKVASTVDPYDVRALGRLMPVLSRYDQDIVHMKSVVSRLVTYQPFYDRLLTLEHVLSSTEMDKVVGALSQTAGGEGLTRILAAMRSQPVLDREFSFLVSLIHQIRLLRRDDRGGSTVEDLHSTMMQILDSSHGKVGIPIRLENDTADRIWPTLQTWGVLRRSPDCIEVRYRDDRAIEFIHRDGTPRLPEVADDREEIQLSLRDLVLSQMQNDAFLLGVLENPKAVNMPGIVGLIATHCKSLRVLDRICRGKALYTGAANKDVPRLLLQSPARIPLTALRRFIHVRFVPKTDLVRMTRSRGTLRPEVFREVDNYTRSLMSN